VPKGRNSKIIQIVAREDVVRKTEKLSEKTGLSMSAVAALAISELAERKGVVLTDEPDPNQLVLDLK